MFVLGVVSNTLTNWRIKLLSVPGSTQLRFCYKHSLSFKIRTRSCCILFCISSFEFIWYIHSYSAVSLILGRSCVGRSQCQWSDLEGYGLNQLRPLLLNSLTLIPTWMSNHMPGRVWGEITYPFPNFNGCTVEVWEWISNFIPHFIMNVITVSCWD